MAPFLGEVLRVDEAGQPHTLMVLQRYLDNQGDAWTWTLNNLDRAFREHLSGVEGDDDLGALTELKVFATILGKRIGEMHTVLARPVESPDFGYRLSSEDDSAEWAASISAQLRQALEALSAARGKLGGDDAASVEWLLAEEEQLLRVIGRLATLAVGGVRIRVHGDLHLGQVLVVQGDAYIIDFEGEPSRPLAERRQRHSPMKDVAGVLRSFDYAAAVARRNACGADGSPESREACAEVIGRYRANARSAFLDAYRLAANGLPHEWHGREGEGAALALFSIEKAAYEILYESGHRPDWLDVPLHGLLELARHLLGHRT
ncbi:putative maltokinase [compost metagenome]